MGSLGQTAGLFDLQGEDPSNHRTSSLGIRLGARLFLFKPLQGTLLLTCYGTLGQVTYVLYVSVFRLYHGEDESVPHNGYMTLYRYNLFRDSLQRQQILATTSLLQLSFL